LLLAAKPAEQGLRLVLATGKGSVMLNTVEYIVRVIEQLFYPSRSKHEDKNVRFAPVASPSSRYQGLS